MPRPCKRRRIRGRPNSFSFKPKGIPNVNLERVVLSMAEFEAVRLKDYQQLSQEECAAKMQISQPTFHRLLISARKKIANALIVGKSLEIDEPQN